MKALAVLFLFFMIKPGFSSENYFCGTKNQSETINQSGWFIDFYPQDLSAHVIKAESSDVIRQYDYNLKNIDAATILLTSDYGDTITLRKAEGGYFAQFSNNEKKEEFSLLCFSSNSVRKIAFSKEISKLSLQLSQLNDLSFYQQNLELPFQLLAQRIQQSISDIGDWEDTILNEEQNLKVMTALSKDIEFKAFLSMIESDILKNRELKKIGLLFGRDWYTGEGKVAVVLKYKKQIIVVPYAFAGDTVFGDARLDYVY